jgi:hypothetical protein
MTRAHYVFPSHPGLDCKHYKNRNRHQANPLIVDCCPSQDCQRDISHQRNCQSFLHKRLYERSLAHARDFANGFPLHSPPLNCPIWCTGEDSNLRTSQGGADLQSAGFNHSPTCAEMLLSGSPLFRQPLPGLQLTLGGVCACSRIHCNGGAHNSSCAQNHRNWKSFLMECRLKAANAAAPCKRPAFGNRSWSWRRDLNP